MKNWVIGATTAMILVLVASWAMGWFDSDYSDDPEVAELEQLRDEVVAKPEQERDGYKEQFAERLEGMTEDQRKTFFERSMPIFVKMGAMQMEKRFDEFLAKSPEEQRKALDERIDEQLAREKKGGAARGPGPGGGRPSVSPEKAAEFMKKMNDWTTPDQRAKFDAVMGMYNDRRQQRGLDPVGPGRWR